jgi:hypothetical protein
MGKRGPLAKRLYCISYAITPKDNGHCVQFESRQAAELCRREFVAAGFWDVSEIWII